MASPSSLTSGEQFASDLGLAVAYGGVEVLEGQLYFDVHFTS